MADLLIPEIGDGYTLPGKLKAKQPWPDVNFSYRPALPADAYNYMRAGKATGEDQVAAMGAFLFKHMTSWDVTVKGAPVPITAEVFRRVPQPVLDNLTLIVLGYTLAEQEADAKN